MADDGNLVDPILGVAATDGGRTAIEREGAVWSYRELAGRMAAFAAGLGAHGCAPGGVVALLLDDPADGLVAFLGALLGGAVPVQLDPADASGERARLAALAGAGLVVTELGDGPSAAQILAAGAGAEAAAIRAPGGSRPAQINLSSGSTGLRKAAPLSHAQQIRRSRQTIAALGQGPVDRHLPLVPIHFAYGRQAAVRTLLAGGTVVTEALPADAEAFLDVLRARRITHLEATPSHLRYLLERVPEATGPAMPTLRCLSVSTAMLGPAERLAVRRKLTPNLYVTYSSNEMGVVACARPADLDHDPATVGRPLSGCEIRITDGAGNPLPAGQTGEVRVRTANAAGGYLGDPEASGLSFRDGWFLTGDAGRFDTAGCLFLAGRLDDRINFGGIKIYPSEIEDVLRSFAGIADAAVAAMPSPRYQEVPVAAVESAGPVDYPALFAHCRARLAADRMPRTVLRVDALPRTGNGKVDRPALRRLLAARLLRKPA